MRIGIDACCWSNRRGFGRFTRELVTRLLALAPPHEVTLVIDDWTAGEGALPASAPTLVVPVSRRPTEAARADGARPLADLWRLSRAASRGRFEVFFFPAIYTYYPLFGKTPVVVGFHDAMADRHPDLAFEGRRARLSWRAKTWLARHQATRVVTVSESARGEVVGVLGVDAARVRVITEGAGPEFRPGHDAQTQRAVRRRYGLPEEGPLLLHVGGLSPHKNLERLLEAVARLEAPRGWHLALVGDVTGDSFLGCQRALADTVKRRGLTGSVTFTGFVPDPDLVVLYNAATMLVFPSLAEGFGLPALEAMACGLPVAASRSGSLPEVLGEAAVFFDPLDVAGMAETIAGVLADGALRARLAGAGLERARQFSWEAAARSTLAVLEEAGRG